MSRSNWNLEVLLFFFCGGRKTGELGKKPLNRSKARTNNKPAPPTRNGDYGNRTRITEVGGEQNDAKENRVPSHQIGLSVLVTIEF